MKRFEVQVLRSAGHTYTEIEQISGVPERSARRMAREPRVKSLDEEVSGKGFRIGRPSKVESFRAEIAVWLEENGSLPTRELLRRAKNKGYKGGKSAFYVLVRQMRPEKSSLTMRFEGLPGEFTQHDFGELKVKYNDGRVEKIIFFASRLKYSRFCRVSLVSGQCAEILVRTTCEHFESFGGVPLLAVFDRPRTVALKWKKDGTITEYNPIFEHAMFEMGVGAEVCWPYAPQQKGAVENLVKFVKNSFFKCRHFHDRKDIIAQLEDWHHEVNEERPCRATGVIPRERMKAEASRMRTLKVIPSELSIRIAIRVGPTAMIAFEGNQYSMPPSAASFNGTAYVYCERIRFVAGKYESEHPRYKVGLGKKSTLAQHRSERLAAIHGKRGKQYLKRQDILDMGDIAMVIIEDLVFQKPKSWFHEVDVIHELLQGYGPGALQLAMRMAHAEGKCSAASIGRYLTETMQVGVTI